MRSTTSIRTRLLLTLTSVSLMLLLVSVARYIGTDFEARALEQGGILSLRLDAAAADLGYAVARQKSLVRGYMADHLDGSVDPAALELIDAMRATEARQLAALRELGVARPAVATAVATVEAAVNRWHTQQLSPLIGELRAGRVPPPAEWAQRTATDEIWGALDELDRQVGDAATEINDQLRTLAETRWYTLIVSVLLLASFSAIATMLITRWVSVPLARMASLAERAGAGEEVSFDGLRGDEIGALGTQLERMRAALVAQQQAAAIEAEQASAINRFTERSRFIDDDVELSRYALTVLTGLTELRSAAVHVSQRSTEQAEPVATVGEVETSALTVGGLRSCLGIKQGSLYMTDFADRLALPCPVYPVSQGSLVCVPLVALDELIGAMHLHTDESPSLELRSAYGRVAAHTALSIANRRLLGELRGMANTDGRTGLANSRSFDALLEQLLTEWRQGEQHSVLMLDLDRFKDFNDRYGHPAGDEALRTFASVLRSCIREHDLAARYGGEEFVVLLRGLDVDSARHVAERIRALTAEAPITLGPGLSANITVSVGIAGVPQHGLVRSSVIQAADQALYAAKAGGRNRVVVAGADESVSSEAA